MTNPSTQALIDELVKDPQKFQNFVYTPLEEAIAELDKREADPALIDKVSGIFAGNLPKHFKDKKRVVLARPIVTPNYETLRFMSVSDALDIQPLFFEYHEDKMIFKNPAKYALGRLHFHKGIGKKGGAKVEHMNIVDFNAVHGAKFSSTGTLWDQALVDFHREFFLRRFPNMEHTFFDGSEWYLKNGGNPKDYYANFLALFVRHAILFENFLLNQNEMEFTRNIFLPAFIDILNRTGKKPLVVSLEPTELEGDNFWLCYPYENKEFVEKKLENKVV